MNKPVEYIWKDKYIKREGDANFDSTPRASVDGISVLKALFEEVLSCQTSGEKDKYAQIGLHISKGLTDRLMGYER